MARKKYILRVAVDGNTREELANNLIELAKQFASEKVIPLPQDNAAGGFPTESGGYCDFDYQVFAKAKDEIVCIGIPD